MKQHLSAAPATLALSLVTAALAEFLLSFGLQADVRTQLLGGVAGTLGMALLTGCMAGSRADSAAVAGTPALLAAVLLTGGHWAGTGSALDRMVLRSAKS